MRRFPVVASLCLAVLVLAAGCDFSPKEREAKYVAHGKTLYESGDLVKASLEFRNALQINAVNSDAQYYLGLIAEKQGDLSTAMHAFSRAADADPKNVDALVKAGQLTLMSGDAQGAMGYGDKLIAIAPQLTKSHTLKAGALLLSGKLPAAEKEVSAALAIEPGDVDALILLAGLQNRNQKNDEALATVQRGLEKNPKSVELLTVKLKLDFDAKRTAEVIDDLRQLHALEPQNASYVVDLANQLASGGDIAAADQVFQDAIKQTKEAEALVFAYAGFTAARHGLDDAIGKIKGLIADGHGASNYVLLLEQLYLKAGKTEDATALMTDLRKNGATAEARTQAAVELARIALIQGHKDQALEQLAGVFKEDANNQSAFLLRGLIMLGDGKYDNAIADARSVLHDNLDSVDALRILAQAYAASGSADVAIQTYRSLIRLAPRDPEARVNLANLLVSKSTPEALEQLDTAIALVPDAKDLLAQKAEFLIRTGSPDKAEVIAQELVKDPRLSGKAHLLLGEAAFARADYAATIKEVTQAEALAVPFETTGPVLMNAYLRADKAADGEAYLAKRLAKDPNDSKATILLAVLKSRTNQKDEAERLLNRAIAIDGVASDAYVGLAQLLTEQRRFGEAAKILRDAEGKFPSDQKIATFAAIAYDTAGEFEAARSAYEKIVAKWPTNLVAANNLAALIADVWPSDAAKLDRARQLAEQFRASRDPLLLDTLGWVLARQGNYDDATILLQQAAAAAPQNQQVQFHYALALAQKGLPERAKEVIGKALSGTPEYRGLDEAQKLAAKLN